MYSVVLPNVLLDLIRMRTTEQNDFLNTGNGQELKRILNYRNINQRK